MRGEPRLAHFCFLFMVVKEEYIAFPVNISSDVIQLPLSAPHFVSLVCLITRSVIICSDLQVITIWTLSSNRHFKLFYSSKDGSSTKVFIWQYFYWPSKCLNICNVFGMNFSVCKIVKVFRNIWVYSMSLRWVIYSLEMIIMMTVRLIM